MTIFNLGSINVDLVYRVPHLPRPGETLAAHGLTRGLGGKGANMSVAAARAAAHVVHIGAVGADGLWARDRLMEYGVDHRHISTSDHPTGHAVIAVDDDGENAILLFPGANVSLTAEQVSNALTSAETGDTLIFQNETNAQAEAARLASARGMRVVYAAAPFDANAVTKVMPFLDLLLNELEATQLEAATGQAIQSLPVADIVITLGAQGCRWINTNSGTTRSFPAVKVTAIDTTGAGDTFTGYLVASLDRGMGHEQAILQATRAAALMVTRPGTADVIPDLKDLEDFVTGAS